MTRFCRGNASGFALPTVLVSSVIMLMMLVVAATAAEGVHTALDRQYYEQLAREAAESGVAVAQLCLQSNGYIPSWTNDHPLQPDKDCTGMNSNGASHWVVDQGNIQTTFSVAQPQDNDVTQTVSSVGTVQLLRPSTGLPWRTVTYTSLANVGVNLDLNTLAFGYVEAAGAYFGTIAADNTLRMVGYNGNGQLGNGTKTDSLVPTKFRLASGVLPVSLFTNFVSNGLNTFVLTNQNKVVGVGLNSDGQLGNGSTIDATTPVTYNLPAGKVPSYVAAGGKNTYVLTSDHNLYAAGSCENGLLGYTYTISGCTDQSTPRRVNLPTPSADPNTIPTTNITTDYLSTFVRMQGGRVYGWGANSVDIFGGFSDDTSTPVQIGPFGNSGQPMATQIQTDGVSLWILGSNGRVWGTGLNMYGELGGKDITIRNDNVGQCIDNNHQDGTTVWTYLCNDSIAQRFTFEDDQSIYYSAANKCLDNNAQDGVHLQLYVCNGSPAQKFVLRDDNTIYYPNKNKCVQTPSSNTLSLGTCSTSPTQKYTLLSQHKLTAFNLPSEAGAAKKIWTDQWFVSVLGSDGQVWSAGLNRHGELGDGSASRYQPYPVKFILPAGVTAVDVYNTNAGNDEYYANTYVIGSNGRVYGAGSNRFGQLGNGGTTDTSTPVPMQVINGTTIRASKVMAGYGTAVILTTNHKVYTVGNNNSGQLGDGTTTNSSFPKANKYTNVLPVTTY